MYECRDARVMYVRAHVYLHVCMYECLCVHERVLDACMALISVIISIPPCSPVPEVSLLLRVALPGEWMSLGRGAARFCPHCPPPPAQRPPPPHARPDNSDVLGLIISVT